MFCNHQQMVHLFDMYILSKKQPPTLKSYLCVCKTTLSITIQQSPPHFLLPCKQTTTPPPPITPKIHPKECIPPLLPYLNQLLTAKPSPCLTSPICFHQTDASRPPSPIVPPTIPYLAVKTLNYKLSCSTCILQHNFPKSGRLNSLTCTPNPPFFLVKQMVSQKIQGIFVISSLHRPPKRKTFK